MSLDWISPRDGPKIHPVQYRRAESIPAPRLILPGTLFQERSKRMRLAPWPFLCERLISPCWYKPLGLIDRLWRSPGEQSPFIRLLIHLT